MKKSSRITNTIKYFGISSATLLAAAPVVAPTVSNVLGWYGANSAFTAKKSEKVSAATQLGTFDRSKYSEYDNLFQNGLKMGISGDQLAEIPAMTTVEGDVTTEPKVLAAINKVLDAIAATDTATATDAAAAAATAATKATDAATAATTAVDADTDASTAVKAAVAAAVAAVKAAATDAATTDAATTAASKEDAVKVVLQAAKSAANKQKAAPANITTQSGINANTLKGLQTLAQLTGGVGSVPNEVLGNGATPEDLMHYLFTNTDGSQRQDRNTWKLDKSTPIGSAINYLSSFIHGGTISGVLGYSVFGDPDKATVKVYIDGQNGSETPNLSTLLQEGVITITLVAQSGDYYGRTAQANLILKNSNILFKGVDAKEIDKGTTGSVFAASNNGSLLSNVADLGDRLVKFIGQTNGSGSLIPKGAVPTLQTGGDKLTDDDYAASGYYHGYLVSGASSAQPWQDRDPKGVDYFAGSAAAKALGNTANTSIPEKPENVGAYTTGSIVVPKGTSYQTIVNDLKNLSFIGTPTSDVFKPGVRVSDPGTVAFDDVKPRPGNYGTWDDFFKSNNVIKDNFFDKDKGLNAAASYDPKEGFNNAAVAHSFSLDVPVYGDIKLGETGDPNASGRSTSGFASPRGKDVFIKDYGASKPRVTARVNVVVYDTKAPEYSLGTKPSFVFFNKSTNSNAIYSTVYDDGATLLQNELPQTLGNALKLSVNDSRFYTNGEFSSQKFASYIAEKFGQSVENKEILISDEDKATSDKNVDLSNLPKDTDFPNANKYTIRSDKRGKNISVDASGVDLSKAGSGTLKITYTNSKNEHGIGTETATLTLPYQVGVAVNPVFYFMDGIDQTITAGDKFNPMMFKVTQDQDSMDNLVSSGEIYDKAPYVNNPSKTGLDVTVGGNVDTATPGNYTLTYVAKNVATGATTTLTRNITVLAKSDNKDGYDVNDFKTIGYVNYVPGYGIAVYDAPNGQFTSQRLPHGSAWKISHQAVSRKNSKDVWYQVGKNQWIKADYVSMTPVSNARYFNAVGRVNYVPGYSIKVWKDANKSQWTGKYLANGTSWKVFGEQDGFYNVGGNQWVEKQYIELSK